MSDEEVGLVVEGGVEAPVVGKPDEQTSNHPPAFDGKDPAVAGSTGRERDDAEGQHPDQPQQAPQQFRIWPRR
jgi:hypothetical protein